MLRLFYIFWFLGSDLYKLLILNRFHAYAVPKNALNLRF